MPSTQLCLRVLHEESKTRRHIKGKKMNTETPIHGDIIQFKKSTWYALGNGERCMVTSQHDTFMRDAHLSLVPIKGLYNKPFWGPESFRQSKETFSASGGPFIAFVPDATLRKIGTIKATFWRWKDTPRAGGGVDYEKEVTLWEADVLRDKYNPAALQEEAEAMGWDN